MNSLQPSVSAPIISNDMNLSSHPALVGLARVLFATSGFILSLVATVFHALFGNATLPPEVKAKNLVKRQRLRSPSANSRFRVSISPVNPDKNQHSYAQAGKVNTGGATPLGLSCPVIVMSAEVNDDCPSPQHTEAVVSGVEFRQGFKLPGLKPMWLGEKPKLTRSHSSPSLPQLILQSPSPPSSPLLAEPPKTAPLPPPKKKQKAVRKIPSSPSLKLSNFINASSKKSPDSPIRIRNKAIRSLTLPSQECAKIKSTVEGGFLAPPN